MVILFHGTTEESAQTILKEGFKKGTYFARHLEDSLHLGGDIIFEVYFEEDPTKCWEYIAQEPISPSRIKVCYKTTPEVMFENKECLREIRKQTIIKRYDENVAFCEECEGRGQLEDFPLFTRWRGMKETTVCPKCQGFGAYPLDNKSIYDHAK